MTRAALPFLVLLSTACASGSTPSAALGNASEASDPPGDELSVLVEQRETLASERVALSLVRESCLAERSWIAPWEGPEGAQTVENLAGFLGVPDFIVVELPDDKYTTWGNQVAMSARASRASTPARLMRSRLCGEPSEDRERVLLALERHGLDLLFASVAATDSSVCPWGGSHRGLGLMGMTDSMARELFGSEVALVDASERRAALREAIRSGGSGDESTAMAECAENPLDDGASDPRLDPEASLDAALGYLATTTADFVARGFARFDAQALALTSYRVGQEAVEGWIRGALEHYGLADAGELSFLHVVVGGGGSIANGDDEELCAEGFDYTSRVIANHLAWTEPARPIPGHEGPAGAVCFEDSRESLGLSAEAPRQRARWTTLVQGEVARLAAEIDRERAYLVEKGCERASGPSERLDLTRPG